MTDPRPPYTPWLTPYLIVVDAEESLDFYLDAFDFEVGNVVRGEEDNLQHVEMYYHDEMVVMFSPEGAYGMESKAPITQGTETYVTFYLYTDNVDALFLQATENGGIPTIEPQDMPWGDRICGIEDPNGYRWLFARTNADAEEDENEDEDDENEGDTADDNQVKTNDENKDNQQSESNTKDISSTDKKG